MSLRRALAIGVGLAVSVFVGGCGVRCEAPYRCDIRARSCQRDVAEALRCVRGGETVDVPISVVDADAYADEASAEIDSERAELLRSWYRGLALLELAARDLDAEQAARQRAAEVGAFYRFEDRAVTVLHRGEPLDGPGAVHLLAHELVHAQQDAEHDLGAFSDRHADSFDSSLALAAVIEGEAELHAGRFSAYGFGLEADELRWDDALAHYRRDARLDAFASESPWVGLRADFAYPFGASYVRAAFEQGGQPAVAALYERPPRSTRQVVQGYGSSPPGGQPWLEPELEAVAVPQLRGFTYLASERAGAYAFEIAKSRWGGVADSRNAQELAARLRADVLTVQINAAGAVVVSWRLRFADEATARRAVGAELTARWARPERDGRDVLILAGSQHAFDDLEELRDPDDPDAPPRVRVLELSWGPVPIAEPEPDDDEPERAARRLLRCAPRSSGWW